MTTRDFRFGVSLLSVGSRSAWHAQVRQAESLGYDILQVPDHLGTPAPFPALVSAAEATSTMKLGTYVLNVGVLAPAYLARDVADFQRLSDNRLELGLGTGYVPSEFEAAGLEFGSGGTRLRVLEDRLTETRALLDAVDGLTLPPLMLSGAGPRMVALAGREADIFSFSIMAGVTPGMEPEAAFGQRVDILRKAAGDRFEEIELNLFVGAVGASADELDFPIIRQYTGLEDELIVQLPGMLIGAPGEIAERLLRYREQWGISYVSVLGTHMNQFAEVIKHLR